MPVLINSPAQQFAPLQAAIGVNLTNPWVLQLLLPGNNDNDVRARALVLVFVDFGPGVAGRTFAMTQERAFYDRSGWIIRYAGNPQDIIRVVPFYDYPNLVVQAFNIPGLT